jgi:inorganic pyrophosphatase
MAFLNKKLEFPFFVCVCIRQQTIYTMKSLFSIAFLILLLSSCNKTDDNGSAVNLLHGIAPFTSDSLVNVVIEIPAGTREKWEVDKETGQIEWDQVTQDSFRVVNYLPYPANYGFVPQTLLPKSSGGDGDPVDVFVLGSSIARGQTVKVNIVGIIHMLDNEEADSKLLAISAHEQGFDPKSYEKLTDTYPGVVEILQLWLTNYKGANKIKILSVNDEKDAFQYLKSAIEDYIDHQ